MSEQKRDIESAPRIMADCPSKYFYRKWQPIGCLFTDLLRPVLSRVQQFATLAGTIGYSIIFHGII